MAPTDSRHRFPTVRWGEHQVTFRCTRRHTRGAAAVIVFAWQDGGFLLADITGRGWCTPSGRIEAGETAARAAAREAYEETGAKLGRVRLLGEYLLRPDEGQALKVPAYAARVERIGALPPGSESRGARRVAPADLPGVYYRWDPLLAAVFALAERELAGGASDTDSRGRSAAPRLDGGTGS